jgi:hypothetical protein
MKLSAIRIKRTLSQLEEQGTIHGPRVIPADNPATQELNDLFGDHTFFVDKEGLHIVEPAEPATFLDNAGLHVVESAESAASVPTGKLISLANWKDSGRTALKPHQPQATGVIVVLGAEEPTQDELDELGDEPGEEIP